MWYSTTFMLNHVNPGKRPQILDRKVDHNLFTSFSRTGKGCRALSRAVLLLSHLRLHCLEARLYRPIRVGMNAESILQRISQQCAYGFQGLYQAHPFSMAKLIGLVFIRTLQAPTT